MNDPQSPNRGGAACTERAIAAPSVGPGAIPGPWKGGGGRRGGMDETTKA